MCKAWDERWGMIVVVDRVLRMRKARQGQREQRQETDRSPLHGINFVRIVHRISMVRSHHGSRVTAQASD